MFGITFFAGPFVAAIVFFGSERLMRHELPHLFPSDELSAVQVPRLRVRTRMLAPFLLLGLLPLAVLSVAALTAGAVPPDRHGVGQSRGQRCFAAKRARSVASDCQTFVVTSTSLALPPANSICTSKLSPPFTISYST